MAINTQSVLVIKADKKARVQPHRHILLTGIRPMVFGAVIINIDRRHLEDKLLGMPVNQARKIHLNMGNTTWWPGIPG